MLVSTSAAVAEDAPKVVFEEDFNESLGKEWKWRREKPGAWKIENGSLWLKILPGNLWGPPNDAENVLVRPIPASAVEPLEATARIEATPVSQYEQVNLVWYYDDSNMVKLGLEMVDGQLSIVMGREKGDKTRTISINPFSSRRAELRLVTQKGTISGFFRADEKSEWKSAGSCDLPSRDGSAHLSLQAYHGRADADHWAELKSVTLKQR